MTQHLTIEAPSAAAFVSALARMDHETRAIVTATENDEGWAVVEVSPMTDTKRAVFPLLASGIRGDTRKRGQAGVMVDASDALNALPTVVERARRMHA